MTTETQTDLSKLKVYAKGYMTMNSLCGDEITPDRTSERGRCKGDPGNSGWIIGARYISHRHPWKAQWGFESSSSGRALVWRSGPRLPSILKPSYRCLWKNTPPEQKTLYQLSEHQIMGLESSFCCWTAGQGLARKECVFYRHRSRIIVYYGLLSYIMLRSTHIPNPQFLPPGHSLLSRVLFHGRIHYYYYDCYYIIYIYIYIHIARKECFFHGRRYESGGKHKLWSPETSANPQLACFAPTYCILHIYSYAHII